MSFSDYSSNPSFDPAPGSLLEREQAFLLKSIRSDLGINAPIDEAELLESSLDYLADPLETSVRLRLDKLLGGNEEKYIREQERLLSSEFSELGAPNPFNNGRSNFYGKADPASPGLKEPDLLVSSGKGESGLFNGGRALVWNKKLGAFETDGESKKEAATPSAKEKCSGHKGVALGFKKGFLASSPQEKPVLKAASSHRKNNGEEAPKHSAMATRRGDGGSVAAASDLIQAVKPVAESDQSVCLGLDAQRTVDRDEGDDASDCGLGKTLTDVGFTNRTAVRATPTVTESSEVNGSEVSKSAVNGVKAADLIVAAGIIDVAGEDSPVHGNLACVTPCTPAVRRNPCEKPLCNSNSDIRLGEDAHAKSGGTTRDLPLDRATAVKSAWPVPQGQRTSETPKSQGGCMSTTAKSTTNSTEPRIHVYRPRIEQGNSISELNGTMTELSGSNKETYGSRTEQIGNGGALGRANDRVELISGQITQQQHVATPDAISGNVHTEGMSAAHSKSVNVTRAYSGAWGQLGLDVQTADKEKDVQYSGALPQAVIARAGERPSQSDRERRKAPSNLTCAQPAELVSPPFGVSDAGLHLDSSSKATGLVQRNELATKMPQSNANGMEYGQHAGVGELVTNCTAVHSESLEYVGSSQYVGADHSWASMLGRSKCGQESLEYIPPTMVKGKPVVHVKTCQFETIQQRNKQLILGSFVGKRQAYGFVKDIVSRTWSLKNGFNMKPYGEHSFSFEFASQEDREKVLSIRSFHIASKLFVVRPWRLFAEADLHELKSIPIWVLFKKVPMELWDTKGFSQIGSAVGRPLFADKITEEMKRTKFARLCIEVDTNCKFEDDVTVILDECKAIKIDVEYNWRPTKCAHCQVFGHSVSTCPKQTQKGKTVEVWVEKNSVSKGYSDQEKGIEEQPSNSEGAPQASLICERVQLDIDQQVATGHGRMTPVISNQKDKAVAHSVIQRSTKKGKGDMLEGGWEKPKKRHTFHPRNTYGSASKGSDAVTSPHSPAITSTPQYQERRETEPPKGPDK